MSIYRTLKGYNIKSVTSDPANTNEGQIWFNNTLNKIKVNTVKPAAWAAGGNLGQGRSSLAGAGTQTAGLVFGGSSYPPLTRYNLSEEYNGSAWTEGNNLNQARNSIAGCGTQTAALGFGGYIGPTTAKTEEYNGTSWAEQNDLSTARYDMGSAGTQTAGLVAGGNTGSGKSNVTEEFTGKTTAASAKTIDFD